MRKVTLLATAAFLLGASIAQADDNEVYLEQAGDSNEFTATQTGSGNIVGESASKRALQSNAGAGGNKATIEQVGDSNELNNFRQTGSGNSGGANNLTFIQRGDNNFVNTSGQKGEGNRVRFVQEGNDNGSLNRVGSLNADAPAPGSTSIAGQAISNGIAFHSTYSQTGVRNVLNQKTDGDNNFTQFIQNGDRNQIAGKARNTSGNETLGVTGDRNILYVEQFGTESNFVLGDPGVNGDGIVGSDNVVLASQNGFGNGGFATVDGAENTFELYQNGDLNTFNGLVDGNANTMLVSQTSNGNTASLSQVGNGNSQAVDQN